MFLYFALAWEIRNDHHEQCDTSAWLFSNNNLPLGHRWLIVVHFVGPTLEINVGPM